MTPAKYKTERQKRGTLKGVAALLGIHWTTLARRESGVIELTRPELMPRWWFKRRSIPRFWSTKNAGCTDMKSLPTPV